MEGPIGDWGLASQAHEIETGFLGNRRGFVEGVPRKPGRTERGPAQRKLVMAEEPGDGRS